MQIIINDDVLGNENGFISLIYKSRVLNFSNS